MRFNNVSLQDVPPPLPAPFSSPVAVTAAARWGIMARERTSKRRREEGASAFVGRRKLKRAENRGNWQTDVKQGESIDRGGSGVFFGRINRGFDYQLVSRLPFFIIFVNPLKRTAIPMPAPALLSVSHLVFLSSRRFGNQSYLIAV